MGNLIEKVRESIEFALENIGKDHLPITHPKAGFSTGNDEAIVALKEVLAALEAKPTDAPDRTEALEALEALEEIESVISDILSLAHKNGVTELSRFKFKEQCETIRADLLTPAVPNGWQLVPKEPTRNQMAEVENKFSNQSTYEWFLYWADIYKAMLAAAPKPEKGKP